MREETMLNTQHKSGSRGSRKVEKRVVKFGDEANLCKVSIRKLTVKFALFTNFQVILGSTAHAPLASRQNPNRMSASGKRFCRDFRRKIKHQPNPFCFLIALTILSNELLLCVLL